MDFFFLWLCTFVAGFWICKKIKQWQALPPGPWGLPIVGYLPFINQKWPHFTLVDLSRKYGPVYGISMGNIYAVVLSDHKLIREAFAKENFSGRAPLKLVSMWLKNFGMSKHSVSRDKLEKRIAAGVYEIIQNVDKASGKEVDLQHMLTNSLGNVVNDIIFGFKFPPEDKTWVWFRQIQEEGCHEMGTMEVLTRGQAQTHRLYASMIARRRTMLGLDKPKGAEYELHKDLFNDHPEGHIKCIKYSKHASNTEEHFFDPNILIPTDGECILDNFLMEQKRRFESGEESSKFVTDEQLHFLLADMFGAGLDTTSEIVRKEILAVCSEDEVVDSGRLPHLMAAICETQRIRSITPDTYIGNYRVPKGAMVIPLQWALHMDPDIWEDPEEFRPSRFLAEDGCLLKPQEFIPFQTGDELSRMLSCGLVSRLFSKCRIRLASEPPADEEMRGIVGVTLSPPHVLYYCEP
ncbi:Uncharacterized protein OBRU01_03830, partial [Operophtera brumata]